jgi:hypothetical protein
MNFNFGEVLPMITAQGIPTASVESACTLKYMRLTRSRESSQAPTQTNA